MFFLRIFTAVVVGDIGAVGQPIERTACVGVGKIIESVTSLIGWQDDHIGDGEDYGNDGDDEDGKGRRDSGDGNIDVGTSGDGYASTFLLILLLH